MFPHACSSKLFEFDWWMHVHGHFVRISMIYGNKGQWAYLFFNLLSKGVLQLVILFVTHCIREWSIVLLAYYWYALNIC